MAHPICDMPLLYDAGKCCGNTPCTQMQDDARVEARARADCTDYDALSAYAKHWMLQIAEADLAAEDEGLVAADAVDPARVGKGEL